MCGETEIRETREERPDKKKKRREEEFQPAMWFYFSRELGGEKGVQFFRQEKGYLRARGSSHFLFTLRGESKPFSTSVKKKGDTASYKFGRGGSQACRRRANLICCHPRLASTAKGGGDLSALNQSFLRRREKKGGKELIKEGGLLLFGKKYKGGGESPIQRKEEGELPNLRKKCCGKRFKGEPSDERIRFVEGDGNHLKGPKRGKRGLLATTYQWKGRSRRKKEKEGLRFAQIGGISFRKESTTLSAVGGKKGPF